jgi:hypothetical protein
LGVKRRGNLLDIPYHEWLNFLLQISSAKNLTFEKLRFGGCFDLRTDFLLVSSNLREKARMPRPEERDEWLSDLTTQPPSQMAFL